MSLVALAAVLAGGFPALPGQPSVEPWPIGPGPAYRPAATFPAVEAGKPLGALRCRPPGAVFALHIELYADRRVVVVPAGIGVASPSRRVGASVIARGCTYPLATLGPAGIVEVARGTALRLADLFEIWGQPLGGRRLASFSSRSPLRAYLGGRLFRGPVASIPLTRHAEIVLELGGYVPPHPFFLFAGGDS